MKEDRLATYTWLSMTKPGGDKKYEDELDKDDVCHQFCSNCTTNALPRKFWKGLETSK